jgi:hypothetical protein
MHVQRLSAYRLWLYHHHHHDLTTVVAKLGSARARFRYSRSGPQSSGIASSYG